jgi:hypothetical protein
VGADANGGIEDRLTGTAPQGWATPYVIVLIIVGVILIGIFIFWQSIYKFPLMPLYIWRDRNFSLVPSPPPIPL